MERLKILNAEPDGYSHEALAILRGIADVDLRPVTRAELLGIIAAYDAVIVRLAHRVDDEIMEKGTRLRAVVTATTGLNHIDLEAAERRGIAVLSLRGETRFLDSVTSTAEHTWGLILALARNIPRAHASVLARQWDRDRFRGVELSGRTLGIIGYGRLGRIVAEYGLAFRMRVLAADPGVERVPEAVCKVSLEELLQQSDVVSVHVPWSESTAGLIAGRELAMMKPGSYLVNTSRGGIIDEDALLRALETGPLAGAALDVLQDEHSGRHDWMQDNRLIAYAAGNDNLLITPHIGGATFDAMRKTEIFMAKKLAAFLCSGGSGQAASC